MKRYLLFLVSVVLLNLSSIQVFYAQTVQNEEIEITRKKLVKILQDDDRRVKVKLKNGETFKGDITAVDIDFFTILEIKTKTSKTIKFTDLEKVKKVMNWKAKDAWWIAGLGVMVMVIAKGGN